MREAVRIDSNGRRCGVDCACTIGECEFPIPKHTAVPSDVQTLRATLSEILAYVNHWSEDKQHGLTPTDRSMDYVRRMITTALRETEHAS